MAPSTPGDERPRRAGASCALPCLLAGRLGRVTATATTVATTPHAGTNGIPSGPHAAHRQHVNRGRSGTAFPQQARLSRRCSSGGSRTPDGAHQGVERGDVPRQHRAVRHFALQECTAPGGSEAFAKPETQPRNAGASQPPDAGHRLPSASLQAGAGQPTAGQSTGTRQPRVRCGRAGQGDAVL